MADILSLISVALGGKSIASAYSHGKDLQQVLKKLDHINRRVTAMSNDLYLAEKEILVPEYLAKGNIISDIDEIKKSIKALNEKGSASFFTGSRVLPQETERALASDPWHFLKNVRPLEGASLQKSGSLPIVFEFEGIKFVGWKRESDILKEFSFQYDAESDMWLPMDYQHISRIAACPCGSGRKYKHCCGKLS